MARSDFSLSSAAEIQPPVCVGDLDGHSFIVSPDIPTELITKHLQDNPDLPGVLLIEDEKLFGMIPRRTIFERLGRRYGIELFMRKPISILHKDLHIEKPLVIKGNKRVEKTLRKALKRPQETIYDPIVVKHNGKYILLDMQILIMTQAQILKNHNNILKLLNDFDRVVEEDEPENAIEKILDALRSVVPFHSINIFLFGETIHGLSEKSSYFKFVNNDTHMLPEYYLPFSYHQTICTDDENGVHIWKKTPAETANLPKAWMGTPLACPEQYIGLLSLYRYTHTPYSSNEKELASTFAWHLGQAVTKLIEKCNASQKTSALIKQQPSKNVLRKPNIDTIRKKYPNHIKEV